jgi:hypothetical protein
MGLKYFTATLSAFPDTAFMHLRTGIVYDIRWTDEPPPGARPLDISLREPQFMEADYQEAPQVTPKKPPNEPPKGPHPKRRRGAQPGNTNALKHGIYSRLYQKKEPGELDPSSDPGLWEDFDMLRQLIRLTLDRADEAVGFETQLRFISVITVAYARLINMIKFQLMFEPTEEDQILDTTNKATAEDEDETDPEGPC